jgi:hypothetical protein
MMPMLIYFLNLVEFSGVRVAKERDPVHGFSGSLRAFGPSGHLPQLSAQRLASRAPEGDSGHMTIDQLARVVCGCHSN